MAKRIYLVYVEDPNVRILMIFTETLTAIAVKEKVDKMMKSKNFDLLYAVKSDDIKITGFKSSAVVNLWLAKKAFKQGLKEI